MIEATTKKYRWLLIFLLPCDFAITVALMTQPQKGILLFFYSIYYLSCRLFILFLYASFETLQHYFAQ